MAQDVFSFVANGLPFTIELDFAGNAISGAVQSVSGFVNGDPITGLSDYESSDNAFTASPPYVDFHGLSFTTASGGEFNIYDGGFFPLLIAQDGFEGSINNVQLSDVSLMVCFVEGAHIATDRGPTRVERLRVGDLVRTASGALRPVKWLGHRSVDCLRAKHPSEVLPVRVARDAFGPDRPARDLHLSPAHAICVDMLGEVLIPIAPLINGATIRQVDAETVTYWHVELDSHDILLAENLAAESYIEMGNRGFFVESVRVDLNAGPDGLARANAAFCRPFHADGPIVDAARAQLAGRAIALGWRLDPTPPLGLRLLANGVSYAPEFKDGAVHFPVPRGEAWLVCETSRPCDAGLNDDRRDLGVVIANLTLEHACAPSREIALDDPGLGHGFYPVEDGERRWTGGRAQLSRALFADFPAGGVLRIGLAGDPPPRWLAPPQPADSIRRARSA